MAPKYDNQEIVNDESLPAVWELVQLDYAKRQFGEGPLNPLPVETLYIQALDMLLRLRAVLGPEKSIDDINLIVLHEMDERNGLGIDRYGAPLRPFCDRKPPLIDAYEELQDFVVYLRQHIEEMKRI